VVQHARAQAAGSQVVFATRRPNIVANDNNNSSDVFVRNRSLGVTERLSVSAQGQEGNNDSGSPSISADGRLVVFDTSATNLIPNGKRGVYICQRLPASFDTGVTIYLPLIGR
jgi:Tol biopolymer transport system component